MTNTKHTPGPLTVNASVFRGKDDNQYTIVSNYSNRPEGVDFMDAYVNISGYYGTYGPHVFAAAPELLEALVELRKWMGPCGIDYEIDAAMQAADKAIAKAKGQTT